MLLNTCSRNKRQKNCEEFRWRSQIAPVRPLAMPSLIDAKISLVPKHQTHSTFNLIGSCNKHPNIQSHKATKIHTLTPLTYELFLQNSSKKRPSFASGRKHWSRFRAVVTKEIQVGNIKALRPQSVHYQLIHHTKKCRADATEHPDTLNKI